MNETMTNLDRLRAATEHVHCYPDLAESLSFVQPRYRIDVHLFADTAEDEVRAFTRWSESISTTQVSVVARRGHYHFTAEGRLVGGLPVTVRLVVLDPYPLTVAGIRPAESVPVGQLAALIEGARI